MSNQRKIYIDNIRWITVMLVLIYHVFYLFNGVGVMGGVTHDFNPTIYDTVLYFLYPWFMFILFLISGISARYSLEKRTNKQFIKERVTKLLVPSTLGLVVFQWITGYMNIKVAGTIETIPEQIRYVVYVLAGTGPLWFIQVLFILSLILILIRLIDKKDKIYNFCGKINMFGIILLLIPVWLSSKILNTPVILVYRFGIYTLAFLLGYFILSHTSVQEKLKKLSIPMFSIAVILGIVYTYYYFGTDYSSNECLQSLFTNTYTWIMSLGILGISYKFLDKKIPLYDYMNKSSFGIYILHYPVVLCVCYYVHMYMQVNKGLLYLICILLEIVLTFLLYEVIKRIPIIRYMVLGIKKKK